MEAVVWSEWSEKLELQGCVFGLFACFRGCGAVVFRTRFW